MNFRQNLLDSCAALNLELSEDKVIKLLSFIDLIQKWNKAYNLTSIKTKQEMVALHLLDSLTTIPHLQGLRIIDIGTGAGLPGIPLAICLPEVEFTLLDSNAKKTRFVQQAVIELRLKNVAIQHSRVEDFRPVQKFATVITRAFAELADIVESSRHLVADNGLILAMKGQCSPSELAKVTDPVAAISVCIPNIEAVRTLYSIHPTQIN